MGPAPAALTGRPQRFPGTPGGMGEKITARTSSVAPYVLWGLLHMGPGASMVVSDLADGAPTGEMAAESLRCWA